MIQKATTQKQNTIYYASLKNNNYLLFCIYQLT